MGNAQRNGNFRYGHVLIVIQEDNLAQFARKLYHLRDELFLRRCEGLRRLRQQLPDKTVWAFSGYTWEELTGQSRARCEATGALLSLVDVLVDGEFVEALRDISLRFRGSSNQRLLDVPASLAAGRPIPWEG